MTPKTPRAFALVPGIASLVALALAACGSDKTSPVNYGQPPDAALFDTGNGGTSPYGNDGGGGGPTNIPEAGPPSCSDDLKLCAETFTYPFNGETSVELRGDYAPGAWTQGAPMSHSGSATPGR